MAMKMYEYEFMSADNREGYGYIKAEDKKEAIEILNEQEDVLVVYSIKEVINNTTINKFRNSIQKQKKLREKKEKLKEEKKNPKPEIQEMTEIDYSKEVILEDLELTNGTRKPVVEKPFLNLELTDIKRAVKGELDLKIGNKKTTTPQGDGVVEVEEEKPKYFWSNIVNLKGIQEQRKQKENQKREEIKSNYNRMLAPNKEENKGKYDSSSILFGEALNELEEREKSLSTFFDSKVEQTGIINSVKVEEEVESRINTLKTYRNFKVKDKDLLLFCQRLILMLESGITLLNSLEVLQYTSSKKMEKVLGVIINNIRAGATFSQSLSIFPRVFSVQFRAMAEIGEEAGTLIEVLRDLSVQMEKDAAVKRKIKSASVYPIVILIVLAVFLFAGSVFMIPMFRDMFMDQGMQLPFITELVFAIADVLPFIIGGIVIVIVALILLSRNNRNIELFFNTLKSRAVLKIPYLKNVVISSNMYNFAATMSMMLRNGIQIRDSISFIAKSTENLVIREELMQIEDALNRGFTLPEAMAEQLYFDSILVSTVTVAFTSGALEQSLEKIATFYSDEVDEKVSSAVEMVQPLTMLLIGAIVGPVLIAIYMPILDMSSGALL